MNMFIGPKGNKNEMCPAKSDDNAAVELKNRHAYAKVKVMVRNTTA